MTNFLELATFLDTISSISKRKEKVKYLADFLRSTQDNDKRGVALFLAGRPFSENDERSLNLSWVGIMNAIQN